MHHHQKDSAPTIQAARNSHRVSGGKPLLNQKNAVIAPNPAFQQAGKMVLVKKLSRDDRVISAVIARSGASLIYERPRCGSLRSFSQYSNRFLISRSKPRSGGL